MREPSPGTHRLIRPSGLSAGGLALVLAWIGGLMIAQLTGATPVVIVLGAGFVGFAWATVAGVPRVSGARCESIELPPWSDQGEPFPLVVDVRARGWVWVEVRAGRDVVASGWAGRGRLRTEGSFARRGRVTALTVVVRSAGGPGLVWWSRPTDVAVHEHLVAAARRRGDVAVERARHDDDGVLAGPPGAASGEVDGVRTWREGDSEKFVHWPSTLRARELVVHDRRHEVDRMVTVRARPIVADPDAEVGAVRDRLDAAIHDGTTALVAIGDGPATVIADHDAAAVWSATAEVRSTEPSRQRWDVRALFARHAEPETDTSVAARWWAAGATGVALSMLGGALGHGPVAQLATLVGVAAGGWVTARTIASGEPAPMPVRVFVGIGSLAALLMVLASTGRVDNLLTVLRGPLPQLLIVLVVLHGFECRDRRTIRVALAISAVIVMYAAGLRVDDALGWWMLAWAACFVSAMSLLARPAIDRSTGGLGTLPIVLGGARIALASVATLAFLAVVPVPDGPARLTLPTLVEDEVPIGTPGAIAGPDGVERSAGADTGPDRAPPGQAGGYTGFAQSMDTSVRGDLGDQIVMRVRAPEPDYWRGQTFARFDGRRWYADEATGVSRIGPSIDLPPVLGDTTGDGVQVDEFVQTFFVEADMPNVIFHAYRPSRIIVDADVWTRVDGAIRSSTTFAEGSIYTVVSQRARVDAGLLRGQGHIDQRLSDVGRQVLAPYLEVPASTSPETIELATTLAAGQASTYDVVRAYEAWMNGNVEYDLDAPLPDPGEDAVHDFLFDSRLGFCEQIASSLTVMLRTQGVPARLATGFVAGERDRVAGVFEVKASDAHAWVEVWFPQVGWQAFDPTASVPLSANAEIDSIGADLTDGVAGFASDRVGELLALVGLAAVGLGALRLGRELRHRRERGRWGLLQDRFGAAAARRGASAGAPNPSLARVWTVDDDLRTAAQVAGELDRVAFDPTFADDDTAFERTRELVGHLERTRQ